MELTFMGGGGRGDDVLSPDVINDCVALQREVLCFATSPSAQAAMVEKVGGGRRGGGDKGERNKVGAVAALMCLKEMRSEEAAGGRKINGC